MQNIRYSISIEHDLLDWDDRVISRHATAVEAETALAERLRLDATAYILPAVTDDSQYAVVHERQRRNAEDTARENYARHLAER